MQPDNRPGSRIIVLTSQTNQDDPELDGSDAVEFAWNGNTKTTSGETTTLSIPELWELTLPQHLAPASTGFSAPLKTGACQAMASRSNSDTSAVRNSSHPSRR